MDKHKIVVADDNVATAKLLRNIIQSEDAFDVVGLASNGKELMMLLEILHTDLVLLDINMPYMDGFRAAELISEQYKNIRIIMFSAYLDPWIIRQSLSIGAHGYITKLACHSAILKGISIVAQGGTYLDEDSQEAVIKDYVVG